MNCLLLCRALLDSVGGLCGIQSMILFCLDVYPRDQFCVCVCVEFNEQNRRGFLNLIGFN